jgi:hypothetical protein
VRTAAGTVEVTIVGQDPGVAAAYGRILTARVRVPAGRLEPGPRSHRFHVIDYDAATGRFTAPAGDDLVADNAPGGRFHDPPDDTILADPAFHAQHTWAVAARTLGAFEFALGRRLPWGFPGHELYIVPHAKPEANAYYSPEQRSLLFGYVPLPEGGRMLTCLSHDIVAHETAHAVLDGLRHRYLEPALPDQAAFHEALADIAALLSMFSVREVVEHALGEADADGRIDVERISLEALRGNMLVVLAEQFGTVALHRPQGGLRRSAELDPIEDWRTLRAFEEPHKRGEVLVAAVLRTLLSMWTRRLADFLPAARIDRRRVAEEGATAALHLLHMAIRAVDYLPPVDFEYEDFLEAVLVADTEVAPDDDFGYRPALTSAFAAYGIRRPVDGRVVDLAQADWEPVYHGLNWAAMRSDADEVFRFLWENSAGLGVSPAYYTHVESVRPSVRVGPDGLVVQEVVAEYVQLLECTAGELLARAEAAGLQGAALPARLPAETGVQIFGGGTLVFDQFGRAKYHVTKPLEHWAHQLRRLAYLARNGFYDSRRRLGFSVGAPRGEEFAELHEPDVNVGETW